MGKPEKYHSVEVPWWVTDREIKQVFALQLARAGGSSYLEERVRRLAAGGRKYQMETTNPNLNNWRAHIGLISALDARRAATQDVLTGYFLDYLASDFLAEVKDGLHGVMRYQAGVTTTFYRELLSLGMVTKKEGVMVAALDANAPGWREELNAFWLGQGEYVDNTALFGRAWRRELGYVDRISQATGVNIVVHTNITEGLLKDYPQGRLEVANVMAKVLDAGVRLDTPVNIKGHQWSSLGEYLNDECAKNNDTARTWADLLLRVRISKPVATKQASSRTLMPSL